ncbi:uncharacterized protein LOC103506630 [Diaphorina citri]|uniref:Uncharacterized protein LOC103506630 n=1 Tax=Diaphorina citri TaxID=121845 RepID=A0A3Q0IS33_DIACI|nr:uncharacterized protein LOC103506630 [Diaphorina citri]
MYLNRPLIKTPVAQFNVIPYFSKHISCLFEKPNGNGLCKQNVQLSTARIFYQEENTESALPLTKERARELIMRLNVEERGHLQTTLHEIESDKMKDEYKGQLAAYRWRSKFGRPSRVPSLGDVDPTGSYCPLPEDWLYKKYVENPETIPKPSKSQLIALGVHNAIPFIGFGFLDNFFMIICLSSYVERGVMKLGFSGPNLSPIQLDMRSSRVFANLGRTLGVTIGCLLGMTPLLFISAKEDEKSDNPGTDTLDNTAITIPATT